MNTPIGPFHTTVLAVLTASAYNLIVLGPISQPSLSADILSASKISVSTGASIDFLGNAVENPVRPFVAILGGAKVADKLNVISNLLEKCDTLIIGGGMAYTFLKAKGYEIGKSLVDESKIDYCKDSYEWSYRILYRISKEVDLLLH